MRVGPGMRGNGALNLGGLTFEWDARKASANFKKHRVTFEEASPVFFDPLATRYPDPDHSLDERREVTLGYTMKTIWSSFLLERALQRGPSEGGMKKELVASPGLNAVMTCERNMIFRSCRTAFEANTTAGRRPGRTWC